MITRETFSIPYLSITKSDFEDMIKSAEVLVNKLSLHEIRFGRTGQFNFLYCACEYVLTKEEMLYAINFFDLAVPLPKVSIIIAPTDNPAQPRSGAAISKQLPINHKEIADKISALYAETLDSFSTRNNLERSGFVAIACEIATPLKEFVFSKIPQHLLK